ncbi:MAG: hypothetical protein SPL28_04560 [Bacteroidales bacterium]|nr:hypothetical protein [Bacteroidales bacterium]
MKHLSIITIAIATLSLASCTGQGNTSQTTSNKDSIATGVTKATAPSQDVASQLTKAMTQEHAQANAKYTYDSKTNTVLIVKEVEVPNNQAEEDYAEAIVEHEVPEFITQFKKSNKPGDVTIKSKGATITVSYVNKATGEEITAFDITPDDLK